MPQIEVHRRLNYPPNQYRARVLSRHCQSCQIGGVSAIRGTGYSQEKCKIRCPDSGINADRPIDLALTVSVETPAPPRRNLLEAEMAIAFSMWTDISQMCGLHSGDGFVLQNTHNYPAILSLFRLFVARFELVTFPHCGRSQHPC
jgi:hypothetical protein